MGPAAHDAVLSIPGFMPLPLRPFRCGKHGFSNGGHLDERPRPSLRVGSFSYLESVDDLPARPTSLILHSWDDEGWRYISKTYGKMTGLTVAGVSDQVLGRYRQWVAEGDHKIAGILPPPVTEFTQVRGKARPAPAGGGVDGTATGNQRAVEPAVPAGDG